MQVFPRPTSDDNRQDAGAANGDAARSRTASHRESGLFLRDPRPVPLSSQRADVDIGAVYTYERDFMPPLLSTLRQSGDGLRLRLLLVDNASADGAEQWRALFPNMNVIQNSQRLGYAANLNRVLEASTAPYILLLNTDMHFDPREQCVARMVRFMQTHPDCGLAGCRLHHGDGEHAPSARRFQTLPVILARRFGLDRLLRHSLHDYFYRDRAIDDSWECDWLSGCFFLVRREAFEDVGYLDTGFVKYFEDVDYCLRMSRAGWRVMYHGGTFCYHLEQRASRGFLSTDSRRHARSYLRFLLKWGFAPRRAIPERPARRRAA